MNTIENVLTQLQQQNRPAFMPFFVAGFPNFGTSSTILKVAAQYADVIELGVPYSDPLADGQIIQEANNVVLKNGMTVEKTFALVKGMRASGTRVPVVLMIYANLVVQMGIDRFYRLTKEAGVDGVLVPDVPLEELDLFKTAAVHNNISQVLLASIVTPHERLKKIDSAGSGFTYLVSVLGTTGSRENVSAECVRYVNAVKKLRLQLPLCIGFGIRNKKQAREFTKAAPSGYIIGSAIVTFIQLHYKNKNFEKSLSDYMKSLKL